jgi:hypothetical protein
MTGQFRRHWVAPFRVAVNAPAFGKEYGKYMRNQHRRTHRTPVAESVSSKGARFRPSIALLGAVLI